MTIEPIFAYFDAYKSRYKYGFKVDVLNMEIVENKYLYASLKITRNDITSNMIMRRYSPLMELRIGTNYSFSLAGKVKRFKPNLENRVVELELEIDWHKSKWNASLEKYEINEILFGDDNE